MRHLDTVRNIVESIRPFARIWTDERGNTIATSARYAPDCALALRLDDGHSIFRGPDGTPGVVADRRWAMADMRAVDAPNDEPIATLVGRPSPSDIPRIVAAMDLLGAESLSVPDPVNERTLRAVLGEGVVRRGVRSAMVANAAFVGVGRVAMFREAWLSESERWRAVSFEIAADNLRRLEDWGLPPPCADGGALHACASALVCDPPWQPPVLDAPCGTREGLVAAIEKWSRDFSVYHVRTPDGTGWTLRYLPSRTLREQWKLHAVAFPGDVPPDAPRVREEVLYAAPQRDIAILDDVDRRIRGFAARSALPAIYGALTRSVAEQKGRSFDIPAVLYALSVATARTTVTGPTVTFEGLRIAIRRHGGLGPIAA